MAIALLPFQNCSRLDSTTQSPASKSLESLQQQGNGDGYLKVDGTYVNLDVGSQCTNQSQESSVVVVKNGIAHLVKENCLAIDPVEVTSKTLAKEHNQEALFFGSKLFEKLGGEYGDHSDIVCRGVEGFGIGQEAFADVGLKKTDRLADFNGVQAPVYEAMIKTGTYRADGSLQAKKSEFVPEVFRELDADGHTEIYTFTEKRLHPGPVSVYKLRVVDGVKAEFQFTYPILGTEVVMHSMDCYKH